MRFHQEEHKPSPHSKLGHNHFNFGRWCRSKHRKQWTEVPLRMKTQPYYILLNTFSEQKN